MQYKESCCTGQLCDLLGYGTVLSPIDVARANIIVVTGEERDSWCAEKLDKNVTEKHDVDVSL